VTYPRHSNRHFIVGVLILLVGVVLLLGQIGFVDADKIFMFWPLILLYFGVNRFMRHPGTVGWFWGGVLILLGISFQLQELGLSHVHVVVIWPVFLICAGILLILRRYENRNRWENPPFPGPPAGFPPEPPAGTPPGPPPAPGSAPETTGAPSGAATGAPSATQSNFAQGSGPGPGWQGGKSWNDFHRRMDEISDDIHNSWARAGSSSETSAPRLNDVNIFWGGKRRIVAKNFVGGEIVAVFGGFEIDLREADILGSVAEIEIFTIFGGGEIRVPPNWEIVMETVGIFGGCDDRTRHPDFPIAGALPADGSAAPQPKRLIVKGVAIFGGLGVKN
jgi:hypothetical protein